MNARCCMPARERSQRSIGDGSEPDAFDRFAYQLPIPPAKRADEAASGEPACRDHLPYRRRRVAAKLGALREVAERAPPREAVGGLTEERGRPLRRAFEPEDDPDERRLPAAVRPGDRHELAFADTQVDVLERTVALPVVERDPCELDG